MWKSFPSNSISETRNSTLFTRIALKKCEIDKCEFRRFSATKMDGEKSKFSNFGQKLTFALDKCGKHFPQIAFPKCEIRLYSVKYQLRNAKLINLKFGGFPRSTISKMWKARKRAYLLILEAKFFIDSSPFSTQELVQAFPFPFGSFLCVSYGSQKNGTARESLTFCYKDEWIQKNMDSKKNTAHTKLKKIHTIYKKKIRSIYKVKYEI